MSIKIETFLYYKGLQKIPKHTDNKMDWEVFCCDVNASFPKIFLLCLRELWDPPEVAKFAL